jgi:hypothetical protein
VVHFQPHEDIVRKGDPGAGLYGILAGKKFTSIYLDWARRGTPWKLAFSISWPSGLSELPVRNIVPAIVSRSDPSHRIHLVTGSADPALPTAHSETAPRIRLIIASPVQLVRESLATTLGDHHRVALVDTADLGAIGIAKIANKQPDLVLVDLGQADPTTAGHVIKLASPAAGLLRLGCSKPMISPRGRFCTSRSRNGRCRPSPSESEILALVEQGRSNERDRVSWRSVPPRSRPGPVWKALDQWSCPNGPHRRHRRGRTVAYPL